MSDFENDGLKIFSKKINADVFYIYPTLKTEKDWKTLLEMLIVIVDS